MARQYMTPPTIPDDIYCRQLQIPNSPEWIGTLTGALYPLCFPEAWTDEDGGITPEEAAARFQIIFDLMFEGSGVCADMACCPMRINPFNGRLQQSSDGGLTWFDVEDGPWTESLYPPFSAMPQARPEATAAEKRCAAAATAAYVMRNLYTQTGNTLLNVVAATDWEYAGALGSMLTGFLMTIGAVATQPYVAIATLLGIVGVRQQYVDYPLDDDDEEEMTCIFLEYATLQPSGAVTFDFNGVWGAIDLDSPKNGLVRFLLTMIGPDALNYAGAIDAGITPDCSACTETWTHHFLNGNGNDGMTALSTASGFAPASYDAVNDRYIGTGGSASIFGSVGLTFEERRITQIKATFQTNETRSTVNDEVQICEGLVWYEGQIVVVEVGTGVRTYNLDTGIISNLMTEISLQWSVGRVGTSGGYGYLTAVEISGEGTNPFMP